MATSSITQSRSVSSVSSHSNPDCTVGSEAPANSLADRFEVNPHLILQGGNVLPMHVPSPLSFTPIPPGCALKVSALAPRLISPAPSLHDGSGQMSDRGVLGINMIAALYKRHREQFSELAQTPLLLCEEHQEVVIQMAIRRQYWEGLLCFLKHNRPLSLPLQEYLLIHAAVYGKEMVVPAMFLENESLEEPLLGKALRIAAIHGHGAFIDALLFRGKAASEDSIDKAIQIGRDKLPKETIERLQRDLLTQALEKESLEEPLLGKALWIAAIEGDGASIESLLFRGETASADSIDAAIAIGRNKLPKETIEKLRAYRFRWIGL